MNHRVLSDHFGSVKRKLLEYAGHFDIARHGDIKGYGREALVQEFLATHLPDQVEYLSGEVLDSDDNRSGQIDIIVQSKLHPKIPLFGNIHLAFVDSVVAAVEVKSNLTTQHLTAALDQCKKLKALRRNIILESSPLAAKLTTVPCIIFSFKGPKKDTLINSINTYANKHKISLNAFCPDMVVILDEDYYICKNDGWQFPVTPKPGAYFRDWAGLPHENLVGLYNYLNNVIQAFAAASPRVDISQYFDKSKIRSADA
ncbi:DUF6602 domain-containing protein [Rivihabitans pingtungensis]|uniref:DUF6602 domain-containing protein n=1 Tax=Rivihabitans pingtungensis TaxID=1054498 RepID=UPI0023549ACF|nr:DUF6602 domain-containing protein [Rivihabitans pingtungensis]MCK6436308.1 hypothetical protein [Rivihabitans pingtungensis]